MADNYAVSGLHWLIMKVFPDKCYFVDEFLNFTKYLPHKFCTALFNNEFNKMGHSHLYVLCMGS